MAEDSGGAQDREDAAFAAFSARVEGTNINPQTLLATDYLNHFNEIVMMIEMIPDLPDCLEEARAWHPKSYRDHFADSQFRDKELAIEAYGHVPERFRKPFEEVVGQMDMVVATSLERIGAAVEGGVPDEELRLLCSGASRMLQRLMDLASTVIHGSDRPLDQSEIDGFLAG